jgi:hypothetical protein
MKTVKLCCVVSEDVPRTQAQLTLPDLAHSTKTSLLLHDDDWALLAG